MDRPPVHELSAVNGHSLRFKYRATAIEQQTAQLPSDAFLWVAGAAIATSLIVKLLDRNHEALFVGQWAPTILILGLSNKMVKQHGSDQFDT